METWLGAGEVSLDTRLHGNIEVALQQRQYHLGLGISEATVEFQNPGAIFGDHQTGIKHSYRWTEFRKNSFRLGCFIVQYVFGD